MGSSVDAQTASTGRHSLSLWPEWPAELPAAVFYRDHGTLLLWHPEDAGRAFKMIASCRSHAGVKRLVSLGDFR